jgi:hypothetical protein
MIDSVINKVVKAMRPSSGATLLCKPTDCEYLFAMGASDAEHERSMRAVALVAMRYNSAHHRNNRMIWWHLSEMSLTLWLTRNWTTDEIVTAAAAIPRSGPRQSLPINGSPLSRSLSPRPAETGRDAPVADSTVREGL